MAIDLTLLLRAYALGIFPMADSRDDPEIFWVEPKARAILPLDGFHLSRSLRKSILQERFEVTVDTAFADVIRACGDPVAGRTETWINAQIEDACLRLHALGQAHSVECWMGQGPDRRLVGGLYGISLGRAFFGESMFSRATDASKVALAWLVARLIAGGYELLDCQFMTDHLSSLGAVEISQQDYLSLLGAAVEGVDLGGLLGARGFSVSPGSAGASAAFDALDALLLPRFPSPDPGDPIVSGPTSGQVIVQLLTQTS